MKLLKENIGFLTFVAVVLLLVFATIVDNKGIHTISKNAVYLQGEACTVNMTFNRSVKDITEDMKSCVKLHETYMSDHKLQENK